MPIGKKEKENAQIQTCKIR